MGTILEFRPAALTALPVRKPCMLTRCEQAREAFALAIARHIGDLPDAKFVLTTDLSTDSVSDSRGFGVVQCTLVHDDKIFAGSVLAHTDGTTTARLSYWRSQIRRQAEFIFTQCVWRNAREEYIRWHRGL